MPYLIFAILQLFAINTLDLYSSGVTLQSLVPRLSRVACVAIDTVICLVVAAYANFSARFYGLLSDFLLFIIVWLAPWCAIYLVDSWLRGNRYDPASLLDTGGGLYYRRGGAHWPALISLAAGMVAAALWPNAYSPYVGPLASRIGGVCCTDPVAYVPTAHTLRAETAETSSSSLLPLAPPGFGLLTCFHAVPFQCSISVRLAVPVN